MREFIAIVVAGLTSSLLGAGFGCLVGAYCPEFLEMLFPFRTIKSPVGVGATLGAINGLLLGAASMAAGLFIAALRSRPRTPA